jgi:hypothetical protein
MTGAGAEAKEMSTAELQAAPVGLFRCARVEGVKPGENVKG